MASFSVQQYLQKHKIGGLFEELMGRVVSDQPDEPLLFLIQILERKAGQVTQMRSMGDIRNMAVAKSQEANKPWKSNVKRTSGGMKKSATMPDPKSRKSTNLDDIWDSHGGKSTKKGTTSPETRPKSAWKALDDDDIQASTGYEGPRRKINEEDELAGEFPVVRTKKRDTQTELNTARVPAKRPGPQSASLRHKQELERMILEQKNASAADSGFEDKGMESDEAVEMLEDFEDLKLAGVQNIRGRKGVRVSKSRSRGVEKPEVKISICASCAKVMSGGGAMPSEPAEGTQYGQLPDFDRDSEKELGGSRPHSGGASMSDEEFESVSQVSGPRHPVWQRDDSDSEVLSARKGKHMFSSKKAPVKGRPMYSGTMPQPTKSGMDALFQSEDLHRKAKPGTKGLAQTWAPEVESDKSVAKEVTFEPGSAREKETDEGASDADLVGGATGWQTPTATDYETDATSSVYDASKGRKYMGAF